MGAWGSHGSPQGLLGDPLGASGPPLEPLGKPWGSLGGPRGALREHFWQTGGPAKSLVLFFKRIHFGSRKGPWGTLVGEVEAKTGVDEFNGDRGAHKGTKTKRARADDEKKGPQGPPKGIPLIGPGSPLGRSVRFTAIKPMFLLASLGRSKVLLGDSGGAWGTQGSPQGLLGDPLGGSGPSLGGPWGTLEQPWGGRGAPSKSTFGKQAALQNH